MIQTLMEFYVYVILENVKFHQSLYHILIYILYIILSIFVTIIMVANIDFQILLKYFLNKCDNALICSYCID